ncbi:DUF6069 family protein [Streptacidiphilus sp. N1-3]|uniref:DUF6069 family protein n=1 Tax=Streptacidiphilus alkalitolerans TaxID=3342712 RepID=A0ABV6XAN8_9ACTN
MTDPSRPATPPPWPPLSPPAARPGPRRPRVAAGRLWAAGAATALTAALAALVSVLLIRGVLDIPAYAGHDGRPLSTVGVALGAAAAALAATAVLHLLLCTTPQPGSFFAWIMTLATAACALVPFTTDAATSVTVAAAAVCVLLGLVIGSLLSAAVPSVRRMA